MNDTIPTFRRAHRILFVALLSLASMAAVAAAGTLKAGVFEPPREAPDFRLQGSSTDEVRLSSYRGKVVVLGFGFTSCPAVCPTTLAVLAAARKKLGAEAAGVQVIYVTVDPQRDTPAQMKNYLGTFDPTFIGATGTEQALSAVRKEYGIQSERKTVGNGYTYAHSSYTYLVDRKGVLRALMPYGHSADDYAHDLKILLAE